MDNHKELSRTWMRQDRIKNPAKYLERSRQWAATHPYVYVGTEASRKYYGQIYAKQTARQKLLQRLKDRPCMDCGDWFPTCAMQFDHREPDKKLCNVSRLRSSSIKKLLEEIAKCDIVCANCHFIRTNSRKAARYKWMNGRENG